MTAPLRNPTLPDALNLARVGPLRIAEDALRGDWYAWPASAGTHATVIRQFLPDTCDGAGFLHNAQEVRAYFKARRSRGL